SMSASSATGKKVVVVKKGPKVPSPDEWETVLEVVQPSKMRRVREPERERPQRERRDARPDHKPAPGSFGSSGGEGTTFADLLAASEKRKRERDEKRKR
ncbi:MAG: hypothetical protein PHN93_10620, partial [Sphaerochaetaceae bacterium]|nr:hypothetical protein [Sphaerochaetaceae bacterium]